MSPSSPPTADLAAEAPASSSAPAPVTLGRVFRLWWPLAASWLLMGVELPMFSAVVARLPEEKIHLAAFSSMVFPIALVVEGPIMMLLAASTALCRDLPSYRKLYRFMMVAGAALTAVHAAIAFTPLFHVVAGVMDVPEQLTGSARIGLQVMTLWTWAIAHRRFHQGVLIRFERAGDVWVGTVVRLLANAAVLYLAATLTDAPGIVVGTAGIATGVLVEMAYIAWRAREVVRGPLRTAPLGEPLRRRAFLAFYAPLALSPILMILVQPIGAAAINRMSDSLNSLAAWSPVWGLVFMTRSVGFAFNEVVVALLGRPGAVRALRRFVLILGASTVSILVLVAATPLAELWFERVSGLKPELVQISRLAVALAILMPGYQALQSWYQGALVHAKRTNGITEGVVVYLVVAATLLWIGVGLGSRDVVDEASGQVLALGEGIKGIYVALVCLSVAGITQTTWLALRSRSCLKTVTDPGATAQGSV